MKQRLKYILANPSGGTTCMQKRLPNCLMLIGLLLAGCAHKQTAQPSAALEPPPAPRELRGVWVATVANIDWPSKPGLSTQQQKDESIEILDKCVQLNLNAVIFQVRPACDALYAS